MSDHIVTPVRLTKEEAKEREKYIFSDTYRESLKLQAEIATLKAKLEKAISIIADIGDVYQIDVCHLLHEIRTKEIE